MKVRYWNIWWTLMVISAVGTIIVAILEALGVFHDLGMALAIVGIILSIAFGVVASTRTAVGNLGGQVGSLRDEIELVQAGIGTLRDPLDRIVAILDERLPPAPAR